MYKTFKLFSYVVVVFFLYALFSMMFLKQYYTIHMPEKSQVESGRTVPIEVNYLKIVYVTEEEKVEINRKYHIFWVAGFLVLIIAFAKTYVKRLGSKS